MKRYSTPSLILFSLINLPLSMLMSPTGAMLPNFYLQYTTVTAGALATVMLLMRVFDGITDPLIGFISDRLGSRKPLMVAGVVLSMVAIYPLYQPPAEAGLSYLLLWYLILTLGWTLIEVPHSTLTAALSDDYQERNRVVLWRQLLGFLGGMTFMAMPMLVIGKNHFSAEVFEVLAWFILVTLPLSLLLLWKAVPDYRQRQARPKFSDLWLLWRQLPLLRHFLVAQILFGLATGGTSAMFIIYATYYLGLGEHTAMVAMPMVLSMIASMPLWSKVLQYLDKHKAWALSALMMMCAKGLLIAPIEVGPNALWQLQIGMVANGACIGLVSLVLPSMLADLIDYDRWRNNRDRAATLFAIQALVAKINQGVGGAAALGIAAWFGFTGQLPVSESAALGLKLAFIGWPIALLAPMVLVIWRYRLGRRTQQALNRRLQRREATNPAAFE